MQKNVWQNPAPITDKSSQELAKEGNALNLVNNIYETLQKT